MRRGHYHGVSRRHQAGGGGYVSEGCSALLGLGILVFVVGMGLAWVFGSDAEWLFELLGYVFGAIVIAAMVMWAMSW
jgi:hypothetical protein